MLLSLLLFQNEVIRINRSRLVFKQWIDSGKKLDKAAKGMLRYIATRVGVVIQENEEITDDLLIKLIDSFEFMELENTTKEEKIMLGSISPNRYMEYIATRSKVAKEEEQQHGLFGRLLSMDDMGSISDLVGTEKYVGQLAKDKKRIYNCVISLREDDAIRKDMITRPAWEDFVNSQINEITRKMGLQPRTMEWVGAMHMEPDHPHVHIMYWDTAQKIEVNYVKPELSNTIRKDLTKALFAEEINELHLEKDILRGELVDRIFKNKDSILKKITLCGIPSSEIFELSQECHIPGSTVKLVDNRKVTAKSDELFDKLEIFSRLIREKHSSGSFKYAYLSPEVKVELDKVTKWIIDSYIDISKIYEAYVDSIQSNAELFGGEKNIGQYIKKQNKDFYVEIGNKILMVIKRKFASNNSVETKPEDAAEFAEKAIVSYDTDEIPLPDEPPPEYNDFSPIDNDAVQFFENTNVSEEILLHEESVFLDYDTDEDIQNNNNLFNATWSEEYKKAREYLFGNDEIKPDFGKAYSLLLSEVENNNVLAIHDIGRMYEKGFGREVDLGEAYKWYEKALTGFHEIENEKASQYIEYRIGKMYNAGLGTEQNYIKAAEWFSLSSAENEAKKLKGNKYAQYSLGSLCFRGDGVEQNYETAISLFSKSDEKDFPYASYELAKMHRDGVGTQQNSDIASGYFKKAFTGFVGLETKSHDDKLQYRIGQMLVAGTGTHKDIPQAVSYFANSAELNNEFAQYALGKLYLIGEDVEQDFEKAILYLGMASEQGNSYATYSLGEMYQEGKGTEKDAIKAQVYYKRALDCFVEMDNESPDDKSQYRIGKMYLDGKGTDIDTDKAVEYLTNSAESGNEFAQYTLGKLYLTGEVIPQDFEKAIIYLDMASEQGNFYADYSLGELHQEGKGTTKDGVKAQYYYQKALQGFTEMDSDCPDDKLQYRIGRMCLDAKGTKTDVNKAIKYFTKSAKSGNEFAQYALGKLYLTGEVIPHDFEKAILYLDMASEQGNVYSDYSLGEIYQEGKGTAKDDVKAQTYYKKALQSFIEMDSDCPDDKLQYRIGRMCLDAKGTKIDVNKAIKYLTKSAKSGNEFAQYALGKLYLTGEVIPQDFEKAILYLGMASEQGNSYAAYSLGELYQEGKGTTKDEVKAQYYYQKALQGFTEMDSDCPDDKLQYCIGKMYLDGKGTPINVEKAVEYLTKSAELGNVLAQYSLGKMYLAGNDIKKDIEKSLYFFELSANQGNVYAQLQLGKIFLFGREVHRNKKYAFFWLQRAADQGNKQAENLMYNDKLQDITLAVNLFQAVINIITDAKGRINNKHLFSGHDLTKAERNEKIKMQKENNIEWGD